jgi:hypothetical protein
MTFPRVVTLFKFWRENPPVHIMLSSFLGVQRGRPKSQQEGSGVASFMQFVDSMKAENPWQTKN